MHEALTAVDSMLDVPVWTERLAHMALEILVLAGIAADDGCDER